MDCYGHLLGAQSAEAVAIVVKRHMGRLGYPVCYFAGHSLRRRMANTPARTGACWRTNGPSCGGCAVVWVRTMLTRAQVCRRTDIMRRLCR